jgi:dolichol-phosphate mannosyltransferase
VKHSIVIPAYNEEAVIRQTVTALVAELDANELDFEIVVVDDSSKDATAEIVTALARADGRVRLVRSPNPNGFGFAVRAGLAEFRGDTVSIVMADGSDAPRDVVRYAHVLEEGYDCAFGSRFMRGGRIVDYPRYKLVMNRLVNWGILALFRHGYDDTTNAFKAYRRHVIEALQPFLSPHFNLTVEIPLKAVVRGYSYAIVPISWTNRQAGVSKLRLPEMGSRYAFIILYCLLERHLSRGDYHRMGVHGWRSRPPLRPGFKQKRSARSREKISA